jgi:hypothetical protein
MASYEYRELLVYLYAYGETSNTRKRADGSATGLYLEIQDTIGGTSCFPDERKESGFYNRALRLKMDYLNGLGADRWRIVSHHWDPFRTVEKYLLMREII